jgi:monovalent cation:H+ antiporter-2, CPA2 family
VVIGCGRVGQHLVHVLGRLGIPRLAIEQDIGRVTELERQGVPTLYGDAAKLDILSRVHLKRARAVVVTLPDEAAACIVVATVQVENPHAPHHCACSYPGGCTPALHYRRSACHLS